MPKAKLKAKKMAAKPKVQKMGKPIGKITHYFSKINVTIIKLTAPLQNGDEIRIVGGENTDFNQVIKSMQIDHKEVKKAKKGNSVGLKVKEIAREGYKVYKV